MDPRVQAIKDYFNSVEIERNGARGNIVKINMYPNANKFFLTVEDLVELAELNNKYKDYYLSVNEFCANLCEGKYSMGSGISQKLKNLHERVKELKDELNFKIEIEENLIEEDMNNLKDMMISQLEQYFSELKVKLKALFHQNNAELKESLIDANRILKQELLNTLNNEEFFDLNKFYVQFNEMKAKPGEFEDFLKHYVNNDKTVQFSKSAMDQFDKMSPIFNENYDLDSKMVNYVLNIEKLSSHFIPHEDDMATVLEGFSKMVMKQIDTSMMKARHFTAGEGGFGNEGLVSTLGASPGRAVKAKASLSPNRSPAQKKTANAAQTTQKVKPTNEINCITFKNFQDLQYDHLKFANSNVGTAMLELHGNNFNQKSCEYMGSFLGSLYKLDKLKLNFSITQIAQEYMAPLVSGITKIKGLNHLEVDFSRSKVETEAFEMLSDAISSHSLNSITFCVESMKINPQNIANLANCLKNQKQLKHLKLNLNFNEIDVDDVKLLVEALNEKSLESLTLRFKGCGLPRDAFKKLCSWLQSGVEIYDKLVIDLTMNFLEEDDYQDLAASLETFTSIRELSLSFDSNEMGDSCLDTLVRSFAEYEYLEKLSLNLNRNDLSAEALVQLMNDIEGLGMLKNLQIHAKKNIRKVDQKDLVRTALNKLMCKNKMIDL